MACSMQLEPWLCLTSLFICLSRPRCIPVEATRPPRTRRSRSRRRDERRPEHRERPREEGKMGGGRGVLELLGFQ